MNDLILAARAANLCELVQQLTGQAPRRIGGGRFMFFSPLREEKNPSFTVSYHGGRWWWRDWGTNESGDVISFVEKYLDCSFKEAVQYITGEEWSSPPLPPPPPPPPAALEEEKRDIQPFYEWLKSHSLHREVEMYFKKRGVDYHPEMGAVVYTQKSSGHRYVATPCPSPMHILGLECREIEGPGRITLGQKTLWWLPNKSDSVLVTESILDSLAGVEVLTFKKTPSLLALNGVGNVNQLKSLEQVRPQEVWLALDADEPGRSAQRRAVEIVKSLGAKVVEVDIHLRCGVKDLHKVLLQAQTVRENPPPPSPWGALKRILLSRQEGTIK